MAHGMMGSQVKANQTLHGYADGHQLLASSVAFKARDLKTMLVLSDISGPGTQIDADGYLTGYPLPDSKTYAFARTWPAPEMPRPGCVWTHTILIDFSDLAELPDLLSLLPLFRRPGLNNAQDYLSPVTISTERAAARLSDGEREFTRSLLAGLYGKPRSKIIAQRPLTVNIEAAVLTI